jgi:hypothetical protein
MAEAISAPNAVRSETRALKAYIQRSVETLSDEHPQRSAQEALLFLGAWHAAQPALLIQDPVLEPVDKIIWQVIKLEARRHGATAFPSYALIGARANVGSPGTVARSIAILRATRWMTLCARERDAGGRFRGNVYALHDEPLPLADAVHLDEHYLAFLADATTHRHARVRAVAAGVLETIDADVAAGEDVALQQGALTRRLAAAQLLQGMDETNAHYFSVNQTAIDRLQKLKTVASDTEPPSSNFEDGGPPSKFEGGSSSSSNNNNYINTTTTTTNFKIWQRTKLRFPACLTANERELAERYVHTVPKALRQRVLDVLDARLAAVERGAEPLRYGPLPYLHTLCQRALTGALLPPAQQAAASHGQPAPTPPTTAAAEIRLARSHLVNEIRQLELMIERGTDAGGELAEQVHTLREKLAALARADEPELAHRSDSEGV